MIINEAIILAGGLGTRLRPLLPATPKCLAPIQGKPFILFLIKQLQQSGISRFVFALGYQSDLMIDALRAVDGINEFVFSIEEQPMGTGGAIKLALDKCKSQNVLIVNGDTFFDALIDEAITIHDRQQAICTLLLKAVADSRRYGTVTVDDHQRIVGFAEKNNRGPGLINAGMYLLNIPKFNALSWPPSFSFEKDFLQEHITSNEIFGVASDAYFIDIGIPEDYEKAKAELPNVIGQ